MNIALPSLELRWLMRRHKDLTVPRVYIGPLEGYAGFYIAPEETEEEFPDGTTIDCRRGIIASAPQPAGMRLESTLAHEFRHHWQQFNLREPYDWPKLTPGADHKQEMVEYFTTSRMEEDALLFECKWAPDDVNMQRLDWVRESRRTHVAKIL